MSLWIPEGLSEAALEAFTDLEYARYKLKIFRKQQEGIQADLSRIRSAIAQLSDMVSNLRDDKSRIVSLKEFQKIQTSIENAKSLERKHRLSMSRYEESISEVNEQIQALQKTLEEAQNTGKVLEFKKNDKGKRPKN